MLADLGLNVARSIPVDQVIGLATGNLTLHGGVIRDTTGRIVSHLAMPASAGLLNAVPGFGVIGSIVNGIQLQALSSNVAAVKAATEQILNYSMAATALSGLGLVTSVTGFTFLASRLRRIDQKLNAIEKQTKAIKRFLQSSQRAKLQAAIEHLHLSQRATDEAMRRDLLLQSKQSFTTLAYHYRSQFDEIEDIVELNASEDCYMLACLGSVMATSDLGMGDAARDEMEKHRQEWRVLARRHCGKLLLQDDPVHLLDMRYVQSLPAANLIRLLDFVNGTQRGVQWIDELRKTLDKTTLVRSTFSGRDSSVVDYANKLLVKDEVLQGFSAHMGFLAEKKISISHFSSKVEKLRELEGAKFLLLSHA